MNLEASETLRPYIEKVHEIAPTIREHADRAEQEAQMTPEVAEAFHRSGLFRVALPREMAGGELTIPEMMRLCEEISRIDASAGWNFSICSGGPILAHYISRAAFEKIFGDPRGVSAGSLNPMNARAEKVEGGWRLSGKAQYASGSGHATYLMGTGLVLRDGAPQVVDGLPLLRACFFPIKNAKILNTWSTSGMRGTGSNDCMFENVFVPDEFTFDWLNAKSPWRRGPFANIPLQVLIAGGLAPTILGATRHALDELETIAKSKVPVATRATLRERPLAQMQFAQAEGLLQAARAYFYNSQEEMWRKGVAGEEFTPRDRAHVRLGIVTAVKLAIQAIDLVADAAGMNATLKSGAIERCWRDAHTASQHVQLNTARFEIVGRVLFGMDPNSPII